MRDIIGNCQVLPDIIDYKTSTVNDILSQSKIESVIAVARVE